MSTEVTIHEQVPRIALVALGLLLAATLIGVTAVRVSGIEVREPDAAVLMVRQLRFEDGADGGIRVIDPKSGELLESINGEQGFLRGTLRALARGRHMRGLGSEQPFDLIARTDGRLTLVDPATGQRIDLESFGPTNAAVFGRLLQSYPAAREAAAATR